MGIQVRGSSVRDRESNTSALHATTDSKEACALDAALK